LKSQKLIATVLISLFIIGFFSRFPIQAKGEPLGLSYPSLRFYIPMENSQEKVFQDDNFYFDLLNPGSNNHSYKINAMGEVFKLAEWQKYFSINFIENQIIASPGEVVRFFPIVKIRTNLSFDYLLHFVFTPEIISGGNVLISGAAATAIFTINANVNASRLEIQTTDQGGKERISNLEIRYSTDISQGYNIFKTFSDIKYFNDIVPNGYYDIIATDHETGIQERLQLELFNDSFFQLKFKIISFLPFSIFSPRNPQGNMIINYTVINEYIQLDQVTIILTVTKNNQTIGEITDPIERFDTNISNYIFQTGEYYITGKIYVYENLYLERIQSIYLSMPLFEEIVGFTIEVLPYVLIGVFSVITFILGMKISSRKAKKQLLKTNGEGETH